MKRQGADKWACGKCAAIITGGRRALWEHYWNEHGIAKGHVLKKLNQLTKQQMEKDRNESKS